MLNEQVSTCREEGGGRGGDVLPMGDLLPYAIMAKRSALISPQTVLSRDVSPISMKYLHSCTCTTAARYQQICMERPRSIAVISRRA